MDSKITIQIQVGGMSFSFETNESGEGIEEAIRSIKKIMKIHGENLSSIESKEKARTLPAPQDMEPALSLSSLTMKPDLKDNIAANIRTVSYWNLILALLYFAPHSLTYDDIMALSKEIGKPVSYNWLNTEFQRTKYRGLVRSEDIPGSLKKKYSITEVGRKRAEAFFDKQVGSKNH